MIENSFQPLITTIIPTYRRPQMLRRAVLSVLNQTYPHLRVCIYDNASGDDTGDVVAELAGSDSRVTYHCHEENRGGLENFIYGMKQVNTRFFSFLSDDDLLLPNFYETALKGFDQHPNAMFSAGTTLTVDNSKILGAHHPFMKKGEAIMSAHPPFGKCDGYYSPPDGLFEVIENHLIWTSVLFRREVIDQVGVLDGKVGGPVDLDYLFRVAARFPYVVSPEPCAIYVVHDASYIQSMNLNFVWPHWLDMISNITEDERVPADTRLRAEHALTQSLHGWLFGAGIRAIKASEFEEAYKVAGLLFNKYRQRRKGLMLYCSAQAHQHLPTAYKLLLVLHKLWVIARSTSLNRYHRQLERYAEYLT